MFQNFYSFIDYILQVKEAVKECKGDALFFKEKNQKQYSFLALKRFKMMQEEIKECEEAMTNQQDEG